MDPDTPTPDGQPAPDVALGASDSSIPGRRVLPDGREVIEVRLRLISGPGAEDALQIQAPGVHVSRIQLLCQRASSYCEHQMIIGEIVRQLRAGASPATPGGRVLAPPPGFKP